MKSQRITPRPTRPQAEQQDCRCNHCGNINPQSYPGQPCRWASGEPEELREDQGANCSGFVVSMGGVA